MHSSQGRIIQKNNKADESIALTMKNKPYNILLADDNRNMFNLMKSAFELGEFHGELRWVQDGQELIDYLLRQGNYSNAHSAPLPDLILLDWNMPYKDGRETLQALKTDPLLRNFPVIILSHSELDEDRQAALELGADGYLLKPGRFSDLIDMIQNLEEKLIQGGSGRN